MDLFIYLGKSAAILTLFYLVYFFLLRKDTLFVANRHYLLGGIIAAALFPIVEFTKTIYVEAPLRTPIVFTEPIPETEILVQEAVVINWWQIAVFIYCIGVVFMLISFTIQLFSLGRLINKHPSEKIGNYTYIKVPQQSAPFSFFKYIVFNPELHSQEEMTMILKHEQVHGAQWHSADIIMANLFLIFQWINPMAWLYKKGVEENLEFIADNETVQQVPSLKQYQLALVKASSTFPIPALTNNFYQSFIKKRILMLNKSNSNKINIWKLSIILPLLAVFLWSFNVNEVIEYTESENTSVDANPLRTFSPENEAILTSETKQTETTSNPSEVIPKAVVPSSEDSATNGVTPSISEVPSEIIVENSNKKIMPQDVLLTITKDTSKEELDAMKFELSNMGFSFSYSNVDLNKNNEIIAISISYKDANGNSGNYNVNSGTPINTIIIKSNGKSISVRSGGSGSYSYDNDQGTMTESRREEMEERRVEMKAQMEERKVEMEERREEMKEEMKERRNEIKEEMESSKTEAREELRQEMSERRMEEREVMREGKRKEREVMREHMREQRLNSIPPENLKRITMNTTDAELKQMKKDFKAQGVSFSYNKIKRNSNGEITQIRLKLNNNNGSNSSSSYDSEGKGIKTILVGSDSQTTIMSTKIH